MPSTGIICSADVKGATLDCPRLSTEAMVDSSHWDSNPYPHIRSAYPRCLRGFKFCAPFSPVGREHVDAAYGATTAVRIGWSFDGVQALSSLTFLHCFLPAVAPSVKELHTEVGYGIGCGPESCTQIASL
jgi:hypothetical protein